jgi:hypothetical protein
MSHVDFVSAPSIGFGLLLDDQRYELVQVEPYIRRDGARSAILTWQSECPRCGNQFTVTSGLVAKALNRRCVHCRKIAYRPVSGKKRSEKVRVRSDPA